MRFFCKGIGVVARAESREGEKVGRAEDLMLARIRDEHPT